MMPSSRYVPWRRVKSWHCVACGECCSRYAVPLGAGEYARLVSVYGEKVVRIKLGKPYLQKVGRRCIFQAGRLCSLQSAGLKPYACKVYPFFIRRDGRREKEEAEFWYKDEVFYVYVNTGCRQVKLDKPEPWFANLVIPEAIELYLNRKREVTWLTSSTLPQAEALRPSWAPRSYFRNTMPAYATTLP